MSEATRLNPRTATSDQSIWKDLSEHIFRTNLVTLEHRTNAVPVQPQTFAIVAQPSSFPTRPRLLPLGVEQKIADDFAYIAAVGEGAQSVSAVCIEEHCNPSSLTLHFAAVDAVGEQLPSALQKVGAILTDAAASTRHDPDTSTTEVLLVLIVKQHFQRLLGRLRSAKWPKPKYLSRSHKKPLHQDFQNLIHRLQFAYPRRKDCYRVSLETQIDNLATIYRNFEDLEAGSDHEFEQLLVMITESHAFCTSSEARDYAKKLRMMPKATSQIAAAIKTLQQLEKIGAYRRIACDLVDVAKQYPSLFTKIEFKYLQQYSSVSADIGYESWAKSMHVHAEVQLVVYFDLRSVSPKSQTASTEAGDFWPRTIGTSKYLCYLCYLFLKYHGRIDPNNTHGRLYDQWTIPDLVEFNQQTVDKYRQVIHDIDEEIQRLSHEVGPREGKREAWRVEPMTSRQNLLLADDKLKDN